MRPNSGLSRRLTRSLEQPPIVAPGKQRLRRLWRGMTALAVLLAVVTLAGCTSGPLAPYAWQGTGQTTYDTYAVKLMYTVYGDNLIGSYYLKGASDPSGKAEGAIHDGTITMTLTPNTVCAFDFAGTLTDTRLKGSFTPRPTSCATSGVWDLVRQP